MDDLRVAIHISKLLKDRQNLACRLSIVKSKLASAISEINETLEVKYTGFVVLLKKEGDGWSFVGIVNPDKANEEDIPDEWDLCLPIPDPSTVSEFQGF